MAKTACKKCDPHELCEECPEWIFTLADLIMCMMGLFVILWVLKPSNKDDGSPSAIDPKLAGAIREAFGYVPLDVNSKDPIDIEILLRKLQQMKLNGPGDGGKTRLERKGAEGTDPEVTSIRQGKQAVIGGKLLFDVGQSDLSPETAAAIDEIAVVIRGHRNIALVKGHTSLDDFSDATGTPQQKMELSVRRAQAVANRLTMRGVSPDIIRVQGCSVFEPLIQRAYVPDGQRSNRRVEVEVTATLVEDLQDKPRTAPTPLQSSSPQH
jgi:outer membrane protein OmpA-like peptidoglycan-associated protein